MIIVLFSSCDASERPTEARPDHEYESLKMSVIEYKKSLSESQKTLNAMESELAELLKSSGGDATVQHSSRVERIQAIHALIHEQKERLSQLKEKNTTAQKQHEQLQYQHAKLIENIGHQEEEILLLINELDQYDQRHQQLEADLHSIRIEREKLEEALYQASFFIGNQNELLQEGLVELKGGFLGFGRKAVLKRDFNTAPYQSIDTRLMSVFHLEGKEVKVLSAHPEEAYQIETVSDQQRFTILDPDAFWSRSKHLTVLVQ